MNQWDFPFNESMIGQKIVIRCCAKEDAEELMQILHACGAHWRGGEPLPEITHFRESDNGGTAYFLSEDKVLTYSDVRHGEDPSNNEYIKCTFYAATQEFEAADDNEFLAMIGER